MPLTLRSAVSLEGISEDEIEEGPDSPVKGLRNRLRAAQRSTRNAEYFLLASLRAIARQLTQDQADSALEQAESLPDLASDLIQIAVRKYRGKSIKPVFESRQRETVERQGQIADARGLLLSKIENASPHELFEIISDLRKRKGTGVLS